MSTFKCNFCGSGELKIKRVTQYGPEIELKPDGQYHPVEDFCCLAQKQNNKHIVKSYDPDHRPDPEEVSKW